MLLKLPNVDCLPEDTLKVGDELTSKFGLCLILAVVVYWQADDDEGTPEYWLVDLAL